MMVFVIVGLLILGFWGLLELSYRRHKRRCEKWLRDQGWGE